MCCIANTMTGHCQFKMSKHNGQTVFLSFSCVCLLTVQYWSPVYNTQHAYVEMCLDLKTEEIKLSAPSSLTPLPWSPVCLRTVLSVVNLDPWWS